MVYIYFIKSFDNVDHGLLLSKLRSLGVRGKIGAWLGKFIMNRRQAIRVGNKVSRGSKVLSGVPQVSVIGPLIFLLFIGYLGKDVGTYEATILKYVDDSKVIRGIKNSHWVKCLKMSEWQPGLLPTY